MLLVTVWDKPGYYHIDRIEKTVTHIEASTPNDRFCTDLAVLDPSYSQFFVARSSKSLSIVDVQVGKAYPLILSPNTVQKNSKLAVIQHKTTDLD